jgi:hypothetical protein
MKLWTYLVPIAVTLLKVGCYVESRFRLWRLRELFCFHHLRELPRIVVSTYTALSGAINGISTVRFNLDSYPIGIDCHTSCCMVNSPHLFKNLQLKQWGEVAGINSGLEIKGVGTFEFKVDDDNGTTHKIKIPNSLYLPDLKRCLLSPQHWAQEAGDNHPLPRGTRMENYNKQCVLVWGQGKYKKSIPYNSTSNFPIMYSALSSLAYRAYATTFEALEASFFHREHVLQFPGLCQCNDLAKQEFVAKENINYKKGKSASKGAIDNNDETIKTSNKSSPAEGGAEEESDTSTHMNALTFDPTPPLEEDEEFYLTATDNQAKLMQWHYRLGHLSFPKLKLLAKNGEIPCQLAKSHLRNALGASSAP